MQPKTCACTAVLHGNNIGAAPRLHCTTLMLAPTPLLPTLFSAWSKAHTRFPSFHKKNETQATPTARIHFRHPKPSRRRLSQLLPVHCHASLPPTQLMGDACSRTGWVRREDSRMLKSVSSMELQAARGFGSGPGTTFSGKRRGGLGSSAGAAGGSAPTLPPLGGGGRSGSGSGGMNHSISAPALRR